MSTEKIVYPEDSESIPFEQPEAMLYSGAGWETFGKTSGGRNIPYATYPNPESKKHVLLIGGVHGNETEGIIFLHDFIEAHLKGKDSSPFPFKITVIPVFNVDGLLAFTRQNAALVDLNRNMNTKDWTPKVAKKKYFPGEHPGSEPETKALEAWLKKTSIDYIISFHSWKPMINLNGPARPHAEAMHEFLDFEIVEDIGYPTPGSLGTYAGWEREIPTITLEFQRGMAHKEIFPLAEKGILNSFKVI